MAQDLEERREENASVERTERGESQNGSLDDRPLESGSNDSTVGGDGEEDRESESVFSGDETAELLAEGRRKHGDGSLDEVDRSRTLSSITIESSVGLDLEEGEGEGGSQPSNGNRRRQTEEEERTK